MFSYPKKFIQMFYLRLIFVFTLQFSSILIFTSSFPMYPAMNGIYGAPGMFGMNGMPGMFGVPGMYGMPGMYPFNPYFPGLPQPVMHNIMPPIIPNPPYLGADPALDSISAALRVPLPQGTSNEKITEKFDRVQFPITPKKSNIPVSLLSSNVPKPDNPQVGSIPINPPVSNEREKTEILPKIY